MAGGGVAPVQVLLHAAGRDGVVATIRAIWMPARVAAAGQADECYPRGDSGLRLAGGYSSAVCRIGAEGARHRWDSHTTLKLPDGCSGVTC